jgi:hypothetical protein
VVNSGILQLILRRILALRLGNTKTLTNPMNQKKDVANMSFLRVEQDGVEFYTLKINGQSGMSIRGVAKLCNISHKSVQVLLGSILANKTGSEWLKPLIGKELYWRTNTGSKQKVLRSEVCAAIIGYYAFDSHHKKAEALYSFQKFAQIGIEAWIQRHTGWHIDRQAAEPTFESVEKFINDRLPQGQLAAAIHPGEIVRMLQECDFSAAGYRLYLYLKMMHIQGKEPTIATICDDLKLAPATFKKWLKHIQEWSHCADWIVLTPRKTGKELEIQLRLHKELGGVMEAKTPIGPVDLLT